MPHSPIVAHAAANTGQSANEVTSVASAELAESLGVVRHMTETYSVGRFRYTSLTDAIAQARRMAKFEAELL